MLTTNDFEVMNSILKVVRGILIMYMIEMTWRKVIEWFYLHHQLKYYDQYIDTPMYKKISKLKDKTRFYNVHIYPNNIFQSPNIY